MVLGVTPRPGESRRPPDIFLALRRALRQTRPRSEGQAARLRAMPPLLMVLVLVLLAACRPGDTQPAPAARQACSRLGQSCEVAPGKLGACVLKEPCDGAAGSCFVCQSQH